MSSVKDIFSELASKLQESSEAAELIRPDGVFQEANLNSRKLVHRLMERLVLPQSRFENLPALVELAKLSEEGKSCLILPEHYSNFDLPNLFYILEKSGPEMEKLSNRIIAIAGVKLNEESLLVRSFTEAYTRIVTYPPRSMEVLLSDPERNRDEIQRAKAIVTAALNKMIHLKHSGYIFLVYPAGTRYRPGDENTKTGLKEMDSYLKSFDYVLFLGMAGNTLKINQKCKGMDDDTPKEDTIIFVASDVVECGDFRDRIRKGSHSDNSKQLVADAIMKKLDELHEKALEIYSS